MNKSFMKAILCVTLFVVSGCGGSGGDESSDGTAGDQATATYYRDADGDGYGDPGVSMEDTEAPAGYVLDASDCDDTDAGVYPGAPELCDGKDNNCDGTVDEGCAVAYPLSMAAAGDSITVAYNAEGFLGEQYEVSWALGDSLQVNSHAQRLWALEPGFSWDAEYDNYAVAGANIIDLKDQIAAIVENGPYDYVAVFMGHNDICDASCDELLDEDPGTGMLGTEAFEDRFLDAMWRLYDQDNDGFIDENPPDVVVSSLARVSDLYDAGKDDVGCTSIWSLANICRVVTSGNPVCIAEADKRTQEYNEIFADWADYFGYTYVPQLYETQFTLEDLSDFDCFHPNVQGQNKISEVIWDNGLYAQ